MSNEKDIERKIAEKLSSREFTIKPEWKDDMAERLDEYNKSNKRFVAAIISIIALIGLGTGYLFLNSDNVSSQNKETNTTEVTKHSTEPINNTSKNANQSSINNSTPTHNRTTPTNSIITHKSLKGANTNESETILPANSGINADKSIETDNIAGNSDSEVTTEENKPTNILTKKDIIMASIYPHHLLFKAKNTTLKILSINGSNSQNKTNSKTSRWELGLIMGPSLSAKKQSEGESVGSYFDMSLSISNKLSDKLRYSTGLNYSNYGEQLKYEPLKFTLYDSIFEYRNYLKMVIDSQFNLNIREWIYDTSYVPSIDTTLNINNRDSFDNRPLQANGKTTFTYLEVPFSLSYPVINKNRYSLNLIGGGSVGYLIKSSGSYYRENRIVQAQSQKVIYNAILGAGFDYDIGNNLNFRTQTIFKRNLTNLSSFNTTARRYTSFSLQAGLVYKF